MQHQNTLEPSLQMRGQSPVNCPDSDVKEWGQNIIICLGTNERSALFHFLDVVNECKGNNKILIYNESDGLGVCGKSFSFIASDDGDIPDILCNDAWLYKWDGNHYMVP